MCIHVYTCVYMCVYIYIYMDRVPAATPATNIIKSSDVSRSPERPLMLHLLSHFSKLDPSSSVVHRFRRYMTSVRSRPCCIRAALTAKGFVGAAGASAVRGRLGVFDKSKNFTSDS